MDRETELSHLRDLDQRIDQGRQRVRRMRELLRKHRNPALLAALRIVVSSMRTLYTTRRLIVELIDYMDRRQRFQAGPLLMTPGPRKKAADPARHPAATGKSRDAAGG
jgi:hypothetical protein